MKKILIYNSGGGLGDSIQIIPLLLSLKNHYRKSNIFYLGAHSNHFDNRLKEYNLDIETFDLNIKYFGFRWRQLLFVKKDFNKKKEAKFDFYSFLFLKKFSSKLLKSLNILSSH